GCQQRASLQSVQVPFGLVDPDPHALISSWHDRGIGVIARGAFGGGFLKDSLTESELRALTPKCDWIFALRVLAQQHQRTILELALQYSLRAQSVGVTLLGMRTVDHVRENLRYYNAAALTDEEFAACSLLARNSSKLA
ncbi:MAG: aldo/keto reductase, partial [Gemmatimonadaceae bacterium]